MADYIEAPLNYTVDTGEKPVSASIEVGGRLHYRTGTYEDRMVAIHDARPMRDELTLDEHGFVLTDHATKVTDFLDAEQLKSVYYAEMEALVKEFTGARRVVLFDHTLRTGDTAAQEALKLREPVKVVHNDYTAWSGPQRLRDLLPDEAEGLLERRFAIVQVWRAIRDPIESEPLAVCDARSVAPGDLIAAERRHPGRVGEIYHAAFNPDHRWYYFPRMGRDEALVFKVYDSETDGRARFMIHTSFDDPTSPPGAAPRESIEVRTLAFF